MKRNIKSAHFYQSILIKLILISVAVIALFFLFAYVAGASTYPSTCSSYAYQQCVGKSLYWYDSCGNQQDAQYCPNGCWDNQCQDYNYSCAYHAYKNCVGNELFWYDSCGNKQDSQYCQNGCYDNHCQNQNSNYNYNYNYNYNNNYGNCTYHAYKLCAGNDIYWYDSCGNQQDIYQSCYGSNQTCQYGQCVYQPPVKPYTAHYKTDCYKDNVYWYDSLGAVTGLYKSCYDSNSCTTDTCSAGSCSNKVTCNGTTCATGSADYIKYCAADKSHCGNGTCEPNLGETSAICPSDCTVDLSISFFSKQDANSTQWEKSVQIGQNSQIYFMITVANDGTSQINNVNVSANIPLEVSSLGNLQVNGVLVSGDIVDGINVDSLAPSSAKTITFEGITQVFSTQETRQAVVSSEVSGTTKTDSLEIIFNPSQIGGAAVSGATSTGFLNFLKRWYLWILVGVVLVFLFIVVFRRLSTNA